MTPATLVAVSLIPEPISASLHGQNPSSAVAEAIARQTRSVMDPLLDVTDGLVDGPSACISSIASAIIRRSQHYPAQIKVALIVALSIAISPINNERFQCLE